jgi:hypothetical protein
MKTATDIQKREKSLALTVSERHALLALRKETISEVAAAIDETQKRVSDTINETRKNFRVRRKIAQHLGLTYERCWGEFDPREFGNPRTRLRLAEAPPVSDTPVSDN